ncbi:MAG: 50S ribosomal protein L10, partial [Candidatus Puniceispirillum sp.]|nr:50S ribosomal protein L10 [Candidatus Puniceispirillum sp.]
GKILDKSGVEALAKLPSLDELRGKLVGLLQAPAGKLARVAQAPAGKLARVIKAREDQLQSS